MLGLNLGELCMHNYEICMVCMDSYEMWLNSNETYMMCMSSYEMGLGSYEMSKCKSDIEEGENDIFVWATFSWLKERV